MVKKAAKQLMNEGVLLEGLGGDIPFIEVSAKANINIKELLDLILLVFEMRQNKKDINGKLRLIYEVNPMSYIIEQAGGKSATSNGKNPLDKKPESISERHPAAMGSKKEVERYLESFK